MRAKINSHLDTVEQNTLQELDHAENKIKSNIDNLLQQLSKNAKTVEGLQRDIITVKDYASDLHNFSKSGSLRFQFSGCWMILSVYIPLSFDFPFVRLFGVR
jgi:hypothetical protein